MDKLSDENIKALNELCDVLRPIYLRMRRERALPKKAEEVSSRHLPLL